VPELDTPDELDVEDDGPLDVPEEETPLEAPEEVGPPVDELTPELEEGCASTAAPPSVLSIPLLSSPIETWPPQLAPTTRPPRTKMETERAWNMV
jgi:hypothetical protein